MGALTFLGWPLAAYVAMQRKSSGIELAAQTALGWLYLAYVGFSCKWQQENEDWEQKHKA